MDNTGHDIGKIGDIGHGIGDIAYDIGNIGRDIGDIGDIGHDIGDIGDIDIFQEVRLFRPNYVVRPLFRLSRTTLTRSLRMTRICVINYRFRGPSQFRHTKKKFSVGNF